MIFKDVRFSERQLLSRTVYKNGSRDNLPLKIVFKGGWEHQPHIEIRLCGDGQEYMACL